MNMTFTLRGNINCMSHINHHWICKIHPALRDKEEFNVFKREGAGRRNYQSQEEVKGH